MKPDPTREGRVVEAKFVAGAVDLASLPPPTLVEIAFAGRSNVGKSSLLNAMMQRRSLARTSNTPGCTRQLNMYQVRLADGLTLGFVDLPGYGWARRSKNERSEWQSTVESYLRGRAGLRAVVVIVDVRRGVEDEERQLVEFLQAPRTVSSPHPPEVVLVATKTDKIGAATRRLALEKVNKGAGARAIGFSASTGDGTGELWDRLRRAALA